MGLSWDWDGRDTVPFVRVGVGPARPAPPPPPRIFFIFSAAPPVPPATLGFSLCLAGSKVLRAGVPRSPADEALASWLGSGTSEPCPAARVLGNGGLSAPLGACGYRSSRYPILCISPSLRDGGFPLPWSAAREELGLEEDGWHSSGSSEVWGEGSAPAEIFASSGWILGGGVFALVPKGASVVSTVFSLAEGERKGAPSFFPSLESKEMFVI